MYFFLCVSDEQERVQKKTFVNWINSYLSKVRNTLLTNMRFKNSAERKLRQLNK